MNAVKKAKEKWNINKAFGEDVCQQSSITLLNKAIWCEEQSKNPYHCAQYWLDCMNLYLKAAEIAEKEGR